MGPIIITRVNAEEWWSKAVKLNSKSAMVEGVNTLDADSAWGEIRASLLQRASIDHDGSSMSSILGASREAQFELAGAYGPGRFGLGEDAL